MDRIRPIHFAVFKNKLCNFFSNYVISLSSFFLFWYCYPLTLTVLWILTVFYCQNNICSLGKQFFSCLCENNLIFLYRMFILAKGEFVKNLPQLQKSRNLIKFSQDKTFWIVLFVITVMFRLILLGKGEVIRVMETAARRKYTFLS